MIMLLVLSLIWSTGFALEQCSVTKKDEQCHILLKTSCNFNLSRTYCNAVNVTASNCVWLWGNGNGTLYPMQTSGFGSTNNQMCLVNTTDIWARAEEKTFIIACSPPNKNISIFLGECDRLIY